MSIKQQTSKNQPQTLISIHNHIEAQNQAKKNIYHEFHIQKSQQQLHDIPLGIEIVPRQTCLNIAGFLLARLLARLPHRLCRSLSSRL